jgi:hypothetical protein
MSQTTTDDAVTLPVASVRVGRRTRRDFGDLDALARSIADVGLLQPLAVTPDGRLVAGERRLRAVRQLGWATVPVHVVAGLEDALRQLQAERDENTERLPFKPSEAVALGLRLERLERAAARQRQREGRRRGGHARHADASSVENCHHAGAGANGKTRDRVGGALGYSGRTYEKARAVYVAGKDSPEEFGDLVELMDAGGGRKVNRAFATLRQRQLAKEREAEARELPDDVGVVAGDFRTAGAAVRDASVDLILTDPPYDGGAVPLYADLARWAARVLRPGGVCLAYAGQSHFPAVLAGMGEHLQYVWTFAVRHSKGGDGIVLGPRVRNLWKPVLAFCRPPRRTWWHAFADEYEARTLEKDAHGWQQALAEAEYFIGHLCPGSGLVVDPMAGSGTTLVAAARLGRRWTGFEVDGKVAAQARARLAAEGLDGRRSGRGT